MKRWSVFIRGFSHAGELIIPRLREAPSCRVRQDENDPALRPGAPAPMSTVAGRSPIPPPLAGNFAAGISPRALTVNYFLLSGGELLSKVAAFLAFSRLGRGLGAARYWAIE